MEKEIETISVSIPAKMIEEINRLANVENISVDKIMVKALSQYIRNNEVWQHIFERGEVWAKELGIESEEDVDELIHEFRREQSTNKNSL
ncbi:MAG: ribbon-helix-helix protein, CopG family [Candidatus Poribacteria bacterium]